MAANYPVLVVNNLREVDQAIKEHEISSSYKYISYKKERTFDQESGFDFTKNYDIRFEDSQANARPYIPFDGVPFIVAGKKIMDCHQGKDRNVKKKKSLADKREAESRKDHSFQKQKRSLQTTKKKDCKAKIKIRHIIKFPELQVGPDAKRCEKDLKSLSIKTKIASGERLEKQHQYYISFPIDEEHTNHLKGEAASLLQPIDKELIKYIETMVVHHNITNSSVIKTLLEVYVKDTLFRDQAPPTKFNKRFWPSLRDIRNHVAVALMKLRNNNVDQAVVEEMVNNWRIQYPDDNFFLRTKEVSDGDVNFENGKDNGEDLEEVDFILGDSFSRNTSGNEKFLYIHQSASQKRLLQMYGQEICLMDATYRTTRYSLPLYFICVPTNVNYINVATFITETEDTQSLIEALSIIKGWNGEWKPAFFMCDYADEEINSLETVFPESFVYLCDFHREQAWERWLSASHNGLTNKKAEVLGMLRKVAHASTGEEFNEAKDFLQSSELWKENSKLQNWFLKRWFNKHERWVQAFRKNRFNVSINTNNGIERQNAVLKYDYLQSKKASSLSHLLQVIVESFIPDSYKKYLTLNVKASEEARSYSEGIPGFLRNRPLNVVKHCFSRWEEASNIPFEDIINLNDGQFVVKSQGTKELHYLVQFERNEIGLPSCDCPDWDKTHLPCKHFMAIFKHNVEWNWDSLPKAYTTSPFLNLDLEGLEQCCRENTTTVPEEKIDEPPEETSFQIYEELPRSSAAQLKRARGKLIDLCSIMKDLSYKTKDISVLDEATNVVQSAIKLMEDKIPKTNEFLLDDQPMLNISRPQKNARPKGQLKKTKSRQKGCGRVGRKANMQKKYFTRQGALDLSSNSKEGQSTCNSDQTLTEEVILESVNMDIPESTQGNMSTEGRESDLLGKDTGEEPLMNEDKNGAEELLHNVRAFISSISKMHWRELVQLAETTNRVSLDITCQIGYTVVLEASDKCEDSAVELLARIGCLMPSILCLYTKSRLILIVLKEMVEEGRIKLDKNNDPRIKAKERDKAFQDLIKCVMTMNQMPYSLGGKGVQTGTAKPSILKTSETSKGNHGKKRKIQLPKNVNEHEGKIARVYPSGGLVNRIGTNICFANSLIQCLRVTDIHRVLNLHAACPDSTQCFTCQFKAFIEEGPGTFEPLLSHLNVIWPDYVQGEQQDAHEFFEKLMQEVYDKCHDKENSSGARNIFHGILKFTVVCDNCSFKSVKDDLYSDISVSIDKVQTLVQAVDAYFSPVSIEYRCRSCRCQPSKSGYTAKQVITIESIPTNFVIHLKRFNGALRKITKKIDIPFDLSIQKQVSEGKLLAHKLQLFGVVCHYGRSSGGGHYYSYVKFGQHWFRIDDMKITSVTERAVIDSEKEAYILFYRALQRPYISE